MITASIGSMYYMVGVGVVGGLAALALRAFGALGIAQLIEIGLFILVIAFVAPMLFDFFDSLRTFGTHMGI